ncbi:MAG: hypothetical protein IPL26_29690 [Leptospiraceae bacterium]|nr:hypothetical protein [Leptospiraceae bacterium]
MNTSAFVTSIRVKLEENQYKTYFFLFAFCLLTTSFTIEKFFGNLVSEQLELERKKDYKKGVEASLQERWNLHLTQIKSYAFWPDVWDLVKTNKSDKAYLSFQLDPSLEKQFDFFGIYLTPEKAFITKWSDGSGQKQSPDNKTISHFYNLQNGKEGNINQLIYFNQHYYLVSVTSLADNRGKPMIDGIMIFGYELDNFVKTTNSLFPINIEIVEENDFPINSYDSISLEKLCLPGSKKISLFYSPESYRMNSIRPYIIAMLAIFSFIALGLFSWILHHFANKIEPY